jgi:hypothetical protein
MAEKIKYIGLTKLFLWIDSEKLETYPEALSRLNKDKLYTKPEIASEVFQLIDKGKNNFIRSDKLRNCFGLEKLSDNKLVINGINFFKKLDSKNYHPTNEALSIGKSYKSFNDEDEWLIPLVCHLARVNIN